MYETIRPASTFERTPFFSSKAYAEMLERLSKNDNNTKA